MESCKAECDVVANNEIASKDVEAAVISGQDEVMSLPSSQQTSSPDPMAVNGSCGLYNLGNTCFMNAGLQSLASCPPLLKYFFEEFRLTKSQRGTLTGVFYQLLVKMWSGQYSLLQPKNFKDLLGLYHPQFQDYRQHDCQEFLALLLDTFHEQLNRTSQDTPQATPAPQALQDIPSSMAEGQGHLNNEDLGEPGAAPGKEESRECPVSATSDSGFKLLCPETLSSEEEVGGTGGAVAERAVPRAGQDQTVGAVADHVQGRGSLKRISSSSTEAVMASLFSEDSNHSTLSAHSTDSEQSNAFKKLKIEAESLNAAASVLCSVSEQSAQESAAHAEVLRRDAVCVVQPAAAGCEESVGSDSNNSAENGAESMEMSPPAHSSIPQRKCVRIDIPSSSQGNTSYNSGQTLSKANKEQQLPASETSSESLEKIDSAAKSDSDNAFCVGLKKFNNTEPVGVIPSEGVMSLAGQSCQPAMTSPQDSSRANPLHFYCKETKTLNTNVLVSNFVQGDISTDSEKFAKVDNRSQVPVTKEVNLLQEALQGLEEDKVEKALIGKTLGGGTAPNLITPSAPEGSVGSCDKRKCSSSSRHEVSNLRNVKIKHAGSILCKPTVVDPNLLNNSYEYEDEMVVGYSSLVGTTLHKTGPEEVVCVKPSTMETVKGSMVVEEKMDVEGCGGLVVEVDKVKVSSEVEKNVQMQALAKLKNSLAKSNIREDISDKASTSGSTETEDGDMEAESSASEDEEEEPPSRDSVAGEDNSVTLPNTSCRGITAADVSAANTAWEHYKARNNSVVVDTFQGQFKSTVVCSECDHVSVTYEPFMYLSLPIPHAMERQMCVVFVRPHKSTVRYMLTMHKNDKVQHLRRELQALTGTESCDVIIAEVLDNHVSRILDENIMLRYVNDSTRTIYAFQMLPPPEMPLEQEMPTLVATDDPRTPSSPLNIPSSPELCSQVGETCASHHFSEPLTIDVSGETILPSSSSPLLSMDQVNAMLNAERSRSPSASKATTTLHNQKNSVYNREEEEAGDSVRFKRDGGDSNLLVSGTEKVQEAVQPERADPMLMGTGMWEWNHRHHPFLDEDDDPPPTLSAPPTSPTNSHHSGGAGMTFTGGRGVGVGELPLNVDVSSDSLFPQSPSSMDVEMDHIPSAAELANSNIWPSTEGDLEGAAGCDRGAGDAGAGMGVGAGGCLMDSWQTCAICLEELMDSHLLTHLACKGVFCHTCLEMSAKHSGDLANCCPTCLFPVDVTQDFVPLASSSTVKSKVRLLAVAVTFRTGPLHSPGKGECRQEGKDGGQMEGEGGKGLQLVCGPRLTYLASQQEAGTLYTLVDRVVPFVENYSLHLTDGQGLRCSRCEYSTHCTGCQVAREGEVTLQPCDHLTVHFADSLPLEEVEAKTHVSDDVSVQSLRSSNPISIHDCFEAFTQSEVLDEHNPWYCPCCERNQCAKKTMTVWRYPENLIIHLKRFVYEDLSSTKIDNRVVFPHTSLDVTRFLAGPDSSFNIYDLYSIVCHYGGANSGHYTAFCCHPMTQEWYNYNDETVSQQSPGDSEYDSSYILFFRRQGPQLQFELVKDPSLLVEDDVDATTPLSTTQVYGPHPAPTLPAEQSTTAIVTFETEGFSVSTDSITARAGVSAGSEAHSHRYDFYN